jgi:catechol 2,3-dioxygenase-like lactoylglutathione lyase family enzyme
MSDTQLSSDATPASPAMRAVPMRLEVVIVPVADTDRAKRFYERLGWRLDAEVAPSDDYHLVQMTPPGSPTSIIFGKGVTTAEPGSLDSLLLAVDDVDAAREELIAHGADVGDVFHDAGGSLGGGFRAGGAGRAPGPDPEGRSYASYASFSDPDGNGWLLQEITERLPGRVRPTNVDAIAPLLHETAEHHDAYEKAAPPHDWWDWYAAYFEARQAGSTPDEASEIAGRYMAEVKHVVVS